MRLALKSIQIAPDRFEVVACGDEAERRAAVESFHAGQPHWQLERTERCNFLLHRGVENWEQVKRWGRR